MPLPRDPLDDLPEEALRVLEAIWARVARRRSLPSPPPFPDPEQADRDGLVAVGGPLEPDVVLEAYRRGIFPMADPGGGLGWWSPDPRAILDLEAFHVPRRLQRTIRQRRYEVKVDVAWEGVVAGCADRDETWISPEFARVYGELFRRGVVHTVEAWEAGQLVGGLYGLSLGAAFFAESMFHTATDAGKVCVVALVDRLRARGYRLCDIQMETSATAVFHPLHVTRVEYLARLKEALKREATFKD